MLDAVVADPQFMARRSRPKAKTKRNPRRSASRTRRKNRISLPRLWPAARTRKKLLRVFKLAPSSLQIVLAFSLLFALVLILNGIYQVIRKPTELFFPVSSALNKTPAETWKQYAPIFREHSTAVMTPEFLAALAQVEGSGNPLVRTYWRFSLDREPLDMYKPASSAVGMYQITDGTFEQARRYCVHSHVVVADGPWDSPRSCWFNSLYLRVIPSHAVEMTSAYLDRVVAGILARYGIGRASLQQQQNLATLAHLCGAGAASLYARHGLQLAPGQKCGDHDASGYLARVQSMKRAFLDLSKRDN